MSRTWMFWKRSTPRRRDGRSGAAAATHLDPKNQQEPIDRWDVGLMELIRDRYRCTGEEAAQIRMLFFEELMDWVEMPRMPLGPDGRPVLADNVLAVLDRCAHPEWAERTAQLRVEALSRSNSTARILASTLESEGLTCPHCLRHSRDIRFIGHSRSEPLYFICRECGRSFVPADLEASSFEMGPHDEAVS